MECLIYHVFYFLERREKRGIEIEIEEAEKKRRILKDEIRDAKSKDR